MVNVHCAIFLYTDETILVYKWKNSGSEKSFLESGVYRVLRNVNIAALGQFHAVSYFQEKNYVCLLCDSASQNNCNFIDLDKKVLANKKIPNDLSSYTCGLWK